MGIPGQGVEVEIKKQNSWKRAYTIGLFGIDDVVAVL
jgi:hypothetical protein